MHRYPGNGTIPDIPAGDSLDEWRTAQAVLAAACVHGGDFTSPASNLAAAHLLPAGWDFARDGAWVCRHCKAWPQVKKKSPTSVVKNQLPLTTPPPSQPTQAKVWSAPGQFEAAVGAHQALQYAAATGDAAARVELAAVEKSHGDTHFDVLLYEPIVIHLNADRFIIDPMHALELNIVKTIWKCAAASVPTPSPCHAHH